jgi:predicted nucleic-acid-binding protein
MIGLDTNVLVRYLTRDDPAQYAKVAAFIDAATDRGEQFVVNTAVLCELEWVLATSYGYSREEIARALEQIFATAQFEVDRLDEARQALGDFRSTKADFRDALIGRINRSLGAGHTITFDRDLKAVETFRLL